MTFLKIVVEKIAQQQEAVAAKAEATISSKETKQEDRVYCFCGKRNVKGRNPKRMEKMYRKLEIERKDKMKIKSI